MMHFLGILAGLFLVLSIVVTIVGTGYQIAALVFNYLFEDLINRNLVFIKLHPGSREFLERNFQYYQRLSEADQLIFERRVQKFINMKNFEPRGGLAEVTLDMKTLIAASAIQLTFGFPSLYFRHFDTILVYPDHYQSPATGDLHQGEVNTRGYIVVSWLHFQKGYLGNHDGRNLGLHELAHAWRVVDSLVSKEHNSLDPSLMHQFIGYSRSEMERIANGDHSFFRAYAATNDHEFFAVAVENFFERPAEFEMHHPWLFDILGELLNQKDTIRRMQSTFPG